MDPPCGIDPMSHCIKNYISLRSNLWEGGRKELFYLMTHSIHFIYWTYSKWPLSKKRNPPPPFHMLFFPINSKGSLISTIPKTGQHIPEALLHHPPSQDRTSHTRGFVTPSTIPQTGQHIPEALLHHPPSHRQDSTYQRLCYTIHHPTDWTAHTRGFVTPSTIPRQDITYQRLCYTIHHPTDRTAHTRGFVTPSTIPQTGQHIPEALLHHPPSHRLDSTYLRLCYTIHHPRQDSTYQRLCYTIHHPTDRTAHTRGFVTPSTIQQTGQHIPEALYTSCSTQRQLFNSWKKQPIIYLFNDIFNTLFVISVLYTINVTDGYWPTSMIYNWSPTVQRSKHSTEIWSVWDILAVIN